MKKIILGALLMFVTLTFAQNGTDGLEWIEGYEEAAKISQKTGKPILANFTGSDWCGWCKRLDKEVFSKEEFTKWAKKNVVLLKVDFPKRKKIPTEIAAGNKSLQQAFQVRGYPTLWLFSVGEEVSDITPLGSTGYVKGGAKNWIESISPALPN